MMFPCKNCGEGDLVIVQESDTFKVACYTCETFGNAKPSQGEAIADWNQNNKP